MAVFDLEAVIKLTDQGFKQGLSKAGKAISTFGKVAGVAIGAGVAGVTALTTASVNAYADYEQLSGGVQKLFGNAGKDLKAYAAQTGQTMSEARSAWQKLEYAQNKVIQNAEQAYRTTGMSANEYIENVTGISAALINSYGGDTIKAAQQADKAMRAISDNFNTFGGDIESVKSAYQGFAKQNYTMLDNLKLGYGGTKTEMQRLIADANKYREELGLTGDLTIDKYGDIVEAIDLIQQKQGIAGTTAKEAATTISGSLNMTKAAWKNLVRAFGDKDADLPKYFNALVESAETAFNNILPVAEQALTGIGTVIEDLAPVIGEKLPGLITSGLPKLISAGTSIVSGLISGIAQALPALVDALPDIFNAIKDGFIDAWPALKEAGGKLMEMAGEGIAEAGEKIKEVAGNIWEGIKGKASDAWDGIKSAASETWNGIKSSIAGAWDGIKSAVAQKASAVYAAAAGALRNLIGAVSSVWSAISGAVAGAWSTIKGAVSAAVEAVVSAVSGPIESIIGIVSGVWSSIAGDVSGAWSSISSAVSSAVAPVVDAVSGPIEALVGTVSGVWSSIAGAVPAAWESIKTAVSTGIESVKGLLNFSWSLPSISLPKLPKLNVEWKSIGGISYPSLSWNAKAMFNPYMFTGATLFGAGETGDEILYGRNALMSDISDSVTASNGALTNQLAEILAELKTYLPRAATRPVVLDSGALVGGIGYDVDRQLGDYSEMGGRGLSLA